MTKAQALEVIYKALRRADDPEINDVTRDGDHKNAEIILTTEDGQGRKQVWLLPLNALREIGE